MIPSAILLPEVAVGETGVALVGIDDFDRFIGMATEDRAILQEVGVMDRGRTMDGGQDKAMLGINGRMFLEPEVRFLIFDGSVAFQIARELQRITILILLTFLTVAVRAFLLQIIVAHRAAGRFHQAGVHGHALVDGKPLGLELAQDLGVDLFHGGFTEPAAEA